MNALSAGLNSNKVENLNIYYQIDLVGKNRKIVFFKKLIQLLRKYKFYLVAEDRGKKKLDNSNEKDDDMIMNFISSAFWHPTRVKLNAVSFENANHKISIDLIDDEFIAYGVEEDRLFIEKIFFELGNE